MLAVALVTVYWAPFTYTGATTGVHEDKADEDSSTNPGELVDQDKTELFPDRLRLSEGTSGDSAGGVTLAHEGPTRISSAMMPAGSFALRLKRTKLRICAEPISPVAVLVRGGVGGIGQSKTRSGRIDPHL